MSFLSKLPTSCVTKAATAFPVESNVAARAKHLTWGMQPSPFPLQQSALFAHGKVGSFASPDVMIARQTEQWTPKAGSVDFDADSFFFTTNSAASGGQPSILQHTDLVTARAVPVVPRPPRRATTGVSAVKINGTVVHAPTEPDPLDASLIQARPEHQKSPEHIFHKSVAFPSRTVNGQPLLVMRELEQVVRVGTTRERQGPCKIMD